MAVAAAIPNETQVLDELNAFARRAPTPVSLYQLYEFGLNPTPEKLLTATRFLKTELPVRLALMAKQLMSLPGGLSDMPSIRRVHGWYVESFAEVFHAPAINSYEDKQHFRHLIDRIKRRHDRVVETIAEGIHELKRATGDNDLAVNVQEFLDRFYTQRIGVRMMIGQQVALHQSRPGYVGIICGQTSPAAVTEEAAHTASMLCRQVYAMAPRVEVVGNRELTFKYIPSHLRHIMLELLKNSLRATVETHGGSNKLPPVRVVIADGREDVAIKISDEGGGIPRSGIGKIWTYLYTTAEHPEPSLYHEDAGALAGYGYGLPLSRLYARYFGGDLQVISMEGYGTDAYIHLNKLGTETEKLMLA